MISLSNLSDQRMQKAKTGQWWETHPYRSLSNNSVAYTETPDLDVFMGEWMNLYESKSGERGIFNRAATKKKVESLGRRDPNQDWGTNPCNEIIMRDRQFCNLSQVTVRSDDNIADLLRKIRLASILGTIQSSFTNFNYLTKAWRDNTEEERLLGVGLTGILDNPMLSKPSRELAEILSSLKEKAIETNKEWAAKLGIAPSVAVTTIKPAGNSSQLTDTSSGLHPRHSLYYIRTVRVSKLDPLAQMMIDVGIPCEDDFMNPEFSSVFSFLIKSPERTLLRNNLSAVKHLELWKFYQDHYTEHKPSCTISVRKNEWLWVAAWAYHNFDELSGVSFFPYADHIYKQAPYQECSENVYKEGSAKMPKKIDWSLLREYEKEDSTIGSRELACAGNSCET